MTSSLPPSGATRTTPITPWAPGLPTAQQASGIICTLSCVYPAFFPFYSYPYLALQNETTNPSTYKTLDKPGYWGVHAIGEVWAQLLWVVSQRLITKHGFVDTLFPPAPLPDGTVPEGDFYRPAEYTQLGERKPLVPKHGNSLVVQYVLAGNVGI